MPPAAIIAIIVVALLILWAVVGGGNRDKAVAQARNNAAVFQQRADADPDWGLTETARSFGLTLDLAADQISAPGQAAGRFSGSRLEVETLGDLSRDRTLRNVVLLGVIGAMMSSRDEREMYLTVTGDGFQLAARVPAELGEQARQFAAAYNTRSGALASPVRDATPGDVTAQLAELGRMHSAGQLTDEEFSAAKGRLLSQ